MNLLSRVIPGLSHHLEKVLLLEQCEDGFWATRVRVDTQSGELAFGSRRHIQRLTDAPHPLARIGAYDRAIFALASRSATTIEGITHMTREHPHEPITEGELDAMLFKAFWSFLNRYRPLAAQKFNTHELDPVVANIVVCGVTLHDRAVFNPLDFSGKEVSIRFRGTFVPRDVVNELNAIAKLVTGDIIAIERGAILSRALGGENAYVDVWEGRADAYATRQDETVYAGTVPWGTGRVMRSLATFFGVDESVVPDILARYTKNQVSEKVRRVVERLAKEEAHTLLEALQPLLRAARIERSSSLRFSFHSSTMLPSVLIDEMGLSRAVFVGNGATDAMREAEVLVGYPYLHPQYAFLNQLLRRRARWLVPSAAIK